MAVCCKAEACAAQARASISGKACMALVATAAELAQMTRSTSVLPWGPCKHQAFGPRDTPWMVWPKWHCQRSGCWVCSASAAACGHSCPKSTRGNSRSLAAHGAKPGPRKASRMTRQNTWALASLLGRFKADTHRGSMSSSITRGGTPTQAWATVCSSGPGVCCHQAQASFNKAHRSGQPHCAEPKTAAKGPQGAGQWRAQWGAHKPPPPAMGKPKGSRKRLLCKGTPTERMRPKVVV